MNAQNHSNFIVLKFGGTSVSTRARWNTILEQAREKVSKGQRPVVVCSAVTKISDTLEQLVGAAQKGNHPEVLAKIRERHAQLASELGVSLEEAIGPQLSELEQFATGASLLKDTSPRTRARIMAMGEILSTKLGAAFFKKQNAAVEWVDARSCFVSTDAENRPESQRLLNATVDDAHDSALRARFEALPNNTIVLTQGFIARDAKGETVLLGRGGSDTSAAYFAAKLDAAACEIWTDVPGIFTCDPRVVPFSYFVKTVGYGEAQEIASMGAKVLHPRCIAPCRRHRIPLQIRWTDRPEFDGTHIDKSEKSSGGIVKALSFKRGVTLVSMETAGMWQQVGFLADAFSCFKEHGLSIDLVSTSETNVTVSLDASANTIDDGVLQALTDDLKKHCRAKVIRNCAAVSLVGRRIRALLHQLGPALTVFEEHPIHLVSQAASDLNLTFVVDEDQAERLVKSLHAHLFASRKLPEETFGRSWRELFQDSTQVKVPTEKPWWEEKRQKLVSLAANGPAYVYDLKTVEKSVRALKRLPVKRIFYALKANAHPEILKTLFANDISFECVSMGEVAHLRKILPKLDSKRILFTPNFAPKSEYQEAVQQGLRITVDNVYVLEKWSSVFKGYDIMLRFDVGVGRGHHPHVKTGGYSSKFGISLNDAEKVKKYTDDSGIKVTGLHVHAGSGIMESNTWAELAYQLVELTNAFTAVTMLDIGGGFGVAEKSNDSELNLDDVRASLEAFSKAHPKFEIAIEPGRFFVAHAGVLVTRVTQLKQKSGVHFVGVDAGMNALIRPALYGAHHRVVNLSRIDESREITANVVGPICESGDVMAHARRLPTTKEGDVLMFATAGAYGAVMSSNYNMRGLPNEIVIDEN